MLLQSLFALLSHVTYFVLYLSPASNCFPKPLKKKEELALLTRMKKEGDKEARQTLIEHNLRLVVHVIKKYNTVNVDKEDLISIGTIGLIKAIDSFNIDKGASLSTYAARCIDNEILMYFRTLKKVSADVSINDPIDTDKDGNDLSLMDIIATQTTTDEIVHKMMENAQLYQCIEDQLGQRERYIVVRRFGLDDKKPYTQQQLAKRLGISRSYVSRIEKKALLLLREAFEKANGERIGEEKNR